MLVLNHFILLLGSRGIVNVRPRERLHVLLAVEKEGWVYPGQLEPR